MQNLVPYVTRSGDKYNIPPDQEEAFRADFGEDAQPAASFRTKDGEHYQVPQSMAEDFRKDFPDAQPVRRLSFANGTTRDFTSDELRKFFQDEYVTSPDYKQDRDEDDARQKRQMEALRLAQSEEAGKAESERRLAEAKKQGEERYDMEQRVKSESRGTFWQELGRRMFTAEGIRENAQESVFARPYAYLNDLANSLVGGLLKGSAKIEEGFGRIWGETGDALGNKGIKDAARAMVADAQAGQAAVDRNLPTDMLDTQGKGAVNKVLQVGKNVAGMTGEFAPAAVPGVGQAYAASLVSAGTVNRYAQVYDEATRNGIDPRKADGLAFGAATVDALTNMLLMGKFRGIWSGEKKAMADMAKKRFVQRALGVGMETAKVGGTMAANGAWQEIVDEGAKGAADPDWAKVGEVAFDQFIEGGLFHLVNSGAHHATRIDWSKEPDGIPAGAARDMMESPEGRALIFCNSPQAAAQIFRARKNGEDVSRKMIRDLGLSGNTGLTVADRNAIGDRLLADYQAFKERVRTKMDDVQASALADEIASRSDEGYDNPAFEKVWTKAVAQIKDAREIDDPERRREIVDEALKTTETKGERLQRAKTVKAYNEKLAAEHEAAVSQSRDSSPKAGEETPTPAAPTEKTAQKPPEPTKSDEIRPMGPSAGVGAGNDTPEAAKPVEGEKSGSVTSVYVADIKPGEHFTYNGKELYKNKDGEIVEIDVDKDGKRIERPTRRHFTGEELVDLPDQVESADVKPADGVPRAEEKPAEDTTGSEPARKQVNKGKAPVPAAASEPPPKPKAKNKGKKPPVEKPAAALGEEESASEEEKSAAPTSSAPTVNKGKGKKPVAPAKPPPEPKRTFVDDAGRTHEVNEDISRQLRQNARGEVNRIVNVKSKGVIEEARKQVKRVAASMTNDDLSASLAETVREERRNTTGGKASDILLEEAKIRGLEVTEKPKEMPQPGEWIVGRVDGDSSYAVAGRVISADARGIVVQYYGGHNKIRAGKTVGEEMFKAVVPTDAVDLSIRDPSRPAKVSARSPAVVAADDFIVRNTTLSRDGAAVANDDINRQGEVKPPPRTEDEPRKPFAKPLKIVDAPAAAKEMAGHASQDETRKALTGVHVEKGLMVATDGRHMVIAPAPKGWTDGEYGADGKPVGDDRVYPNWRQVVPDVKKVGYSKIGTVANGDAATDAVDFAAALRRKVVAVTKYDKEGPTVAIGDAACDPSYVSDILGTMFRLGAKSVDVWHRNGKSPVVFKGRNADGEITSVLMPLRSNGESAAERGFTHVRMPLEAPKPKNKGKVVKSVQAAKALGSPDAASPLRPAPKGAELVQGEFDGMGGETTARPEATALKGKSDLSKPDNVKAFREYMKAVSPAPIPQRLSDGSPKAALEWFEANMVGKTFSFDIPGYGHREFTVKPGHIGTLVCKSGRKADGTKIVKGRIAKAGGDANRGFEMVRNGEVSASDVEGWDVLRAKSLPLLPEVFNSFDVAFHEKDARGNDIIILAKKFVNKKGRPNVVVMKLIDDGKTIGPVSAHVKDMTDSWLKNKDLLLTDEGKVYDRSADNSASRRPTSGDNAERNSPETASILPRPGGEVKGGAEKPQKPLDGQAIRPADLAGGDAAERPQHEEAKKPSSDPQNAARNPAALRDPAFVKWAKSKGRAPTPFARRAYDAAQLRAAVPLYRNVFPGMNIVIHDKVEDPAKWTADHPDGARKMIVDPKSGEVLGWYTPQFKEVHLNPGATVETLAHEMLHAVQDWAKTNSPKLAKALDDIARDCPERLRKRIMRAYGVVSPETIMKEWGAFNFMGGPEGGKGKGGAALRDELANRENAAWLGRFWSAAKDAWKDMAAKMGGNRIDLDAIDSKTPQEAMDFLARAFAEGGTVGKANPPGKSVRPAIDMTKPLSVAEKWEVNLHDHRNPLKWLRDEMAKRGSSFADDTDFYEAARLQKGRDQAAVNDANRRLKEYTGKLKKLGVKHEEVVEFMQAQAAKDRNAMILEKFGRENGSGMTDAEAARTIKAFEDAGKGDALREISDFLLDMQREGLQYRVDAGLLSAEDAQRMADREPFHVPFRSAVDPETGDYVQWGSDKALERAEFREAKGRKTLADDVVGWMFSEFIDAHTRGNENRIRKMVADAVRLNPKAGVGKVLKGARKQSAYDFSAGPYKTGANGDGLTGDRAKTAIVDDPRFRESRKNGDGGRKNVLAFKEGGRTHYIELAEGERGERLQAAVNGRDLKSMGKLWNRGMRFWSSTATEWAPTFALRNFAADNIDVFGNYIGEHGIVKGAASYARHLKNAAALTPAITRYIATGEIPQGAGGEWIRRYEESGGMIAGYASEGYGEITAKIDAEIAKGGRSKGAAIARNVALAVPRAVAAVNRYAELLTRISAFRTQCENGMTDHKAALWSRESTVDFNEKGNFTGITNGLWMFSNSTLGASARQMKSIFKSKYGWQTVAAFVGYGFAEGALEALMNGDDDGREAKGEGAGKDVSEYTRANSLYVRTGGRVYRAPFHAGPFSYIKYAGNCAARIAFGRMKPEDAAKELGVEAVSQLFHYTGVGSVNLQSQSGRFADDAATFAGTAAPSVAQPLVQGAFNIDYAGRSIYNEGFPGDKTPRSAQGRRTTPGWAKDAAAWLNEATRSEGHETGYIDLPPEVVKMAGEAVGKNLLRDVMNAGTVCAMAFGDEKYDVRNVPVARDFVREVDGNDRRYNDARKEYEANADYLKKHAREMSAEERRAYVEKFPHAAFVAKGRQRLDGLETEIRRLRKMEDGFTFVKGKAVPREWPEERLEAFRKRRRELQAKFLKAMGM